MCQRTGRGHTRVRHGVAQSGSASPRVKVGGSNPSPMSGSTLRFSLDIHTWMPYVPRMSLKSQFTASIDSGTRAATIQALLDNPGTTLGELRKFRDSDVTGQHFSSITLDEILGKPASAKRGDRTIAKTTKPSGVDTRTPDGRAEYDKAVLKAVRKSREPIGAAEICAVAGGSPLQVRVALARLIAAGQVNWTGKARGTKYEAV